MHSAPQIRRWLSESRGRTPSCFTENVWYSYGTPKKNSHILIIIKTAAGSQYVILIMKYGLSLDHTSVMAVLIVHQATSGRMVFHCLCSSFRIYWHVLLYWVHWILYWESWTSLWRPLAEKEKVFSPQYWKAFITWLHTTTTTYYSKYYGNLNN